MDREWTPNNFGVIHDLICEAYHKPSVEEKLHEVLLKYRQALLNLLKDQKKSKEHRTQLQKEKIVTIKNVQQNANDEYVNSTLLISDLFDVDEYKAAVLLYYGMQQQARLDRTPYEAACYLYYTERSYLLESWKLIINGAHNSLLSPSTRSLFSDFIANCIYSNDDFMLLIIETLKENKKKITDLESKISTIKQEAPKPEQPNDQKSSTYLSKEKKIAIHESQIQYLANERRDLSFILLLVSHFQQLTSKVTIEVLKLLRETDINDDIAFYLQSIVFSSIKAKPQHHNEEEDNETLNQYHEELNIQKKFIEDAENIINPSTSTSSISSSSSNSKWKSKKIRSAILLQWSLFNFFIPRNISQELNISEDHAEEMANEALHHGVFDYLKTCLEIIEHKDTIKLDKTNANQNSNNGIEGSLTSIKKKEEQEAKEIITITNIIDDDLKEIIYIQYDELVEVFIQKFNNGLIRTIKAREEDIDSVSHITNTRNNNGATSPNSSNGDNGNDTNHVYSSFLKLITALYSNRPDSGLHFWTVRYLSSFVRASSEARTFNAKCTHFEMLASLATGEKCATYTYHALEDRQDFQQTLNTTLVTWSALFKALEFYSVSLRQNPEKSLPPQEILLLKEFLKLFKQVVCYSSEAALKFYENYNAIYNIFSLLVCRIPVELKALLFDILRYFCISTENYNTEISYQVFEFMEKVQLLYINKSSTNNGLNSLPNQPNPLFVPNNPMMPQTSVNPFQSSLGIYQQSIPWKDHNRIQNSTSLKSSKNGLLFELEEIESRNETYPEILSFINLLNVLVQNLCLSTTNHLDYNRNSIGLEPYVEFVLEHVYLKVESRSYIHPKEKWMIIETCLNLFENCLATFDITNIAISVNSGNNKNTNTSGEPVNNGISNANFTIPNTVSSTIPPNTVMSTFNNPSNANDGKSTNVANSTNQAQSALLNDLNIISHHPGYFILTQVLSGSSILDKIFEILSIGVDSLNENKMKTSMYPKSILHILRIFMQVFILQNKFLDQIVPEIINLNVDSNISPSMTYLDQLLLFNSDIIIKIAMLINCHKHHEICLYTVKIMYLLSISPFFTGSFESSMFDNDNHGINRIVYLLSRCSESSQIINGFVEHIELDEPEHESYYSNRYLTGMNLIQKSLFKNTTNNNSLLSTLFSNKKNKYINLSNSAKLNYILSKNGEISSNDFAKLLVNEDNDETDDKPGIIHSVRLAIIDLLLKNEISANNTPTLAHFLLGYDVKHSLCDSEISDPMVSTTQIACLHVILDLLRPIENTLMDNNGMSNNYSSLSATFNRDASSNVENWINTIEPLTVRHPILSEMCYELIYHLCVNPNTSSTTMRYLRTREDFFYRQIKSMPIHFDLPQLPDYSGKDINEFQNFQPNMATLYAQIHQRAWLMKTIALELHTTTTSGRRSQTQRLLQVLFDIPQPNDIQSQDMDYAMDYNNDYNDYMNTNKYLANGNKIYEQPLVRMLEILNSLDSLISDNLLKMNEIFNVNFSSDSSSSEPFTEEELSNIDFSSCLIRNERGCFVYDLRRVYSLLVESQEKGQINLYMDDIKYILQKILVINHSRELHHARAHCIEAWRQIMETTFLECYSLLSSDNRGALLYEFISTLLNKMAKETDINVTESLSKVVVALMSQLTRGTEDKELTNIDASTIKYELPIDVLRVILRGILSSISQPGILATTRGFLYTVLLNYLEFTDKNERMKKDNNFASLDMNYTQNYLNEKDTNYLSNYYSFENGYDDIIIENQSIIESYGDNFLEVVCRDASDGPELWKNTAFALLDSLCKLDEKISDIKKKKGEERRQNYVLSFLVRRNFLSHFVGNLKRDDEKLRNIIQNNSMEDSIVHLFTFEAKMTLFLRICQSREGVKKLIENGILESLIDCSYLDYRPEIDSNFDTFLHPTSERYHQLLVPTLRLLVCIMSVVGKDNRIALSRMVSFMNAHQDVIIAILKDKLSAITLTSLEEIFLVTALFPYLVNDSNLMEKQLFGPGHISFHSLLLNLLSKYSLPERWINKLQPVTEFEKGRGQMTTFILGRSMDSSILHYDAQFFAKKICMNILSYSQVVTSNLSTSLKPIFTYAISPSKESEKVQGTSAIYPPPSLALLISFLRNTIDSYYQAVNDHKELSLKLKDIHNLTIEEINEIIYVFFDVDSKDYSPSRRQQLALNEIRKAVVRKSKEILALFYIIEHILLLFWRHLQYYLTFYAPQSIDIYSEYNTELYNRLINPTCNDKGFYPTYEELEKLKMNAPLIVGPVLNKLSQIELTYDVAVNNKTRNNFIQILVRCIKSLNIGNEC